MSSETIPVAQDRVVILNYTLKNDDGEILDSSANGEPLAYLHGNGNLIPGLEKALEGKRAGQQLTVTVPPAEGYGIHSPGLIQDVPRSAFQGVDDLHVGMRFQADAGDEVRSVVVTNVADDIVTVDGNHPLAGQNLNFDVEIIDVRQATREELEHGHVHGHGGHHH